jgi:hypothetical protein
MMEQIRPGDYAISARLAALLAPRAVCGLAGSISLLDQIDAEIRKAG